MLSPPDDPSLYPTQHLAVLVLEDGPRDARQDGPELLQEAPYRASPELAGSLLVDVPRPTARWVAIFARDIRLAI